MSCSLLPPLSRFRLAWAWTAFLLFVALLTRIGLVVLQNAPVRDGWWQTGAALLAGEAFDAVAALWLTAPLVLYLAVLPERWFQRRWQRALLAAGLLAAAFGALFTALAEVFFFLEFNSRFNFVAVDYLMYPTEVVDNIWESYPTGLLLAAIASLSLGLFALLRRPLSRAWETPAAAGPRWRAAAAFFALLLLGSWALPGGLAQVSADRALNEIAGNGYRSFWTALLGSNATYQGLYATRDPGQLFPRLHRLLAEPAVEPASFVAGSTLRRIRALQPERKLNVVVVLEESLGAELVGTLHPRPVSLTPRFDALARQGTLLTRAYSTGNRTIRAIEATTSSLPPLPGISVVRRPQSENLFTLPGLLREKGYQALWVYGGRALFDGMGRYLSRNGIDRIVEQKDYPKDSFRTAWGVADEAIFDRALSEIDALEARGRPFYTLILSVSNHRPYTFPQGPGHPIRPLPGLSRRENVVRYADWALGRFVEQAQGHAFFDHTLFVLLGDHGARVYGAAKIPLASYEVPILFYAPGQPDRVSAGRRLAVLASSLDLPPTILGLLGMSYESRFFGQDLFRAAPPAGRALMTHNHEIALMRGGRIAVLGLQGRSELFAVDRAEGFQPIPRPDAAGRELIEDAVAYYAGADLLYRTGQYELATPPDGPAPALLARLAAP